MENNTAFILDERRLTSTDSRQRRLSQLCARRAGLGAKLEDDIDRMTDHNIGRSHARSWREIAEEAALASAPTLDRLVDADVVRAGVTSFNFANALSDSLDRVFLDAYQAIENPQSWMWIARAELESYRSAWLTMIDDGGELRRLPRGGEAAHAKGGSRREPARLVKYAEQAFADEQDIEGDDLHNVFEQVRNTARRTVQLQRSLIASELLKNRTLTADTKAVFHADHGNDLSSAFSSASLALAVKQLRTQKIEGREAGIEPVSLVVAPSLEDIARVVIRDLALGENGGSIDRLQLNIMSELENGVTDPRDDTTYPGSSTAWFLAGRPAALALCGLKGGWLRPMLSNAPERGPTQYGVAWGVSISADARLVDFRSIVRGNT